MAAIYQWFLNVEIVFTTTLYPITDINSVDISTAFLSGDMGPIPNDYFEMSGVTLQSGSMAVWLTTSSPPDDYFEMAGVTLQAGSLVSALVASTPPDDYFEMTNVTLQSGFMAAYLITVDSPDEKLDVSCAFLPTGSSMTAI